MVYYFQYWTNGAGYVNLALRPTARAATYDEFTGNIPQPLPVYSESVMTTVVKVFRQCCQQRRLQTRQQLQAQATNNNISAAVVTAT